MLRFGPKSLAGQLMLATALTLLVAQAINLALLLGSQRNERRNMIASSAATLITEVDDRIATGQQLPQRFFLNPPERREARPEAGDAAAMPRREDARGGPRRGGGEGRRIVIADAPNFREGMVDWPEMAERVSAILQQDGFTGAVRVGRMTLPAEAERPAGPHDNHRGSAAPSAARSSSVSAPAPAVSAAAAQTSSTATPGEATSTNPTGDGTTTADAAPAARRDGRPANAPDHAHRMPSRGAESDFSRRDPSEVVAVAAQIADGRWLTVRARVPVQEGRLGMMLIGQTVILLGLLLIPLLFMAWRVSRPLSRLAQAARSVRPASEQPPLAETGPSDVRELTRAFNSMRERIVAMLSEKDRMLGAIGHDLRTPLASLRLRVEQVENDRLRDAMIASIENMAAMLEDILALARTGQPREVPENTDVVALVTALASEYAALDRPVTLLVGDGVRDNRDIRPIALQRALRNLVDNAVTYAGAARIAVVQDRDGLIIRIEDDGPGIPEDQLDTIMEPFTRVEESRNRNTGGSGLGLALARAAVQAEGGRLTLANRTPHGLEAQIILPV